MYSYCICPTGTKSSYVWWSICTSWMRERGRPQMKYDIIINMKVSSVEVKITH